MTIIDGPETDDILDALPNGAILTDEAYYHEYNTVVAYVKQPDGTWANSTGNDSYEPLPPLRLLYIPADVKR